MQFSEWHWHQSSILHVPEVVLMQWLVANKGGGRDAGNAGGGGNRTPRDTRQRQNVPDHATTSSSQTTNNVMELDGVSHSVAIPLQRNLHTTTTTMAPAASAAGTGRSSNAATDTNAKDDDIDITSKKLQMINTLMRKNNSKTNEDSFKSETVKDLLNSVMGKAEFILETVKAEKPNLSNAMHDTLFAKFALSDKKRPGKLQHCEKLVDIWLLFKQVDKLKEMGKGRGARSMNLSNFIDTMKKLAKLVDEKMKEDLDWLKTFKSEPKPPGESE